MLFSLVVRALLLVAFVGYLVATYLILKLRLVGLQSRRWAYLAL